MTLREMRAEFLHSAGIDDGRGREFWCGDYRSSLVAASSDGSAGSSGNLDATACSTRSAIAFGRESLDMYSNLVLQVGNLGANAQSDVTSSNASVQQLTDQRSSVSGVSLDEETTNMIRYQRAYEAGARVVTTVDSMFTTLMNMGVTT